MLQTCFNYIIKEFFFVRHDLVSVPTIIYHSVAYLDVIIVSVNDYFLGINDILMFYWGIVFFISLWIQGETIRIESSWPYSNALKDIIVDQGLSQSVVIIGDMDVSVV